MYAQLQIFYFSPKFSVIFFVLECMMICIFPLTLGIILEWLGRVYSG